MILHLLSFAAGAVAALLVIIAYEAHWEDAL
mgnify:CR=1 FL=1